MNTYEFTLKFNLGEPEKDPNEYLDALFEAGCDDATIGVGRTGRIALAFARESVSATDAMQSAVRDVRKIIPAAGLIEATPDVVSTTDMAGIVGISRQAIGKIIVSHIDEFPSAFHEGSPSLWHLSDVLGWFIKMDRLKRDVSSLLMESAVAARALNVQTENETLASLSKRSQTRAQVSQGRCLATP